LGISGPQLGSGSFGRVYQGVCRKKAISHNPLVRRVYDNMKQSKPWTSNSLIDEPTVAIKSCSAVSQSKNLHSDTNAEVTIMKELQELNALGKTRGFVHMLGYFQCGELKELGNQTWSVDPQSPKKYTYIVMDKLGSSLRSEIRQADLSMDALAAYLFETLFAIQTAFHEVGFVARDLNAENIMVASEAVDDSRQGYYEFRLASGQRYFIPRAVTQAKFVQIVDFGLSKMERPSRSDISLNAFVNDPNSKLSVEQMHMIDQFYIGINFLHLLTARMLTQWQYKKPKQYRLLEDLFAKILSFEGLENMMDSTFGLDEFVAQKRARYFDLRCWARHLNGQHNYVLVLRTFNSNPILKRKYGIPEILAHPFFSQRFYMPNQEELMEKQAVLMGAMSYSSQFPRAGMPLPKKRSRFMRWLKSNKRWWNRLRDWFRRQREKARKRRELHRQLDQRRFSR
jgi:serine/threonine protein kinase